MPDQWILIRKLDTWHFCLHWMLAAWQGLWLEAHSLLKNLSRIILISINSSDSNIRINERIVGPSLIISTFALQIDINFYIFLLYDYYYNVWPMKWKWKFAQSLWKCFWLINWTNRNVCDWPIFLNGRCLCVCVWVYMSGWGQHTCSVNAVCYTNLTYIPLCNQNKT